MVDQITNIRQSLVSSNFQLEEKQEKTIQEESSQPEFLRVHSKIIRAQQQ